VQAAPIETTKVKRGGGAAAFSYDLAYTPLDGKGCESRARTSRKSEVGLESVDCEALTRLDQSTHNRVRARQHAYIREWIHLSSRNIT